MKSSFGTNTARVTIGLLIGIGLLALVSHFVNIPGAIRPLQQNLGTPRGILFALLSGVAFLLAYSIRGIRWKLFLSSIGNVCTFTTVRLYLISIFVNFLLPIQGGEVVKTLMLRRIAGIPISRSLPTVAVDRSLDLFPALIIVTIVPFLGIRMDIKLWLVLGTVGGLLLCLVFFTGLTVWQRATAIFLLRKMTGRLPKAMRSKIETSATGLVDSLLIGVSRPEILILAVLLTCIAIIFDSLFAMFSFWTIGFPISFKTVIFGYTIYNMFCILPTPPGQLGSNEAVGLLTFGGLLHVPSNKVIAMFIFSHPWSALLMCTTGILCLKSLGLTLPAIIKARVKESGAESKAILVPEKQEAPVLR